MLALKRVLIVTLLLAALYSIWQWVVSPLIFTLSTPSAITLVNDESKAQYQVLRGENNASCIEIDAATPVDNHGQLRLLSWNIYKQNNPGWDTTLLEQLQRTELSLLQEVSLAPSFVNWLQQLEWYGQQASAFEVFDKSSGVFNLSKSLPQIVCAIFENEPWLQLPKSALFAVYKLSNEQQLWVINLHAVNFTFGTQEFEQQLKELEQAVSQHKGPVIFAGDFNTWSGTRLSKVEQVMNTLGLQNVQFDPDSRTTFPMTDQALDHMFYRGLRVKKAEVLNTSASDHQPLWVEFSLD